MQRRLRITKRSKPIRRLGSKREQHARKVAERAAAATELATDPHADEVRIRALNAALFGNPSDPAIAEHSALITNQVARREYRRRKGTK